MPQERKYDDQFCNACFDLYCEGLSNSKIAKIMDVDPNVIKRLKKRNFPENWEKGRSERVRMKTHFLHKNALETYEQTLIIQQNLLLEITEQLAKLICEKAENCLLDDRVAMEGLLECMREARRLYLPLQDQFTCKRCNKKWDST